MGECTSSQLALLAIPSSSSSSTRQLGSSQARLLVDLPMRQLTSSIAVVCSFASRAALHRLFDLCAACTYFGTLFLIHSARQFCTFGCVRVAGSTHLRRFLADVWAVNIIEGMHASCFVAVFEEPVQRRRSGSVIGLHCALCTSDNGRSASKRWIRSPVKPSANIVANMGGLSSFPLFVLISTRPAG